MKGLKRKEVRLIEIKGRRKVRSEVTLENLCSSSSPNVNTSIFTRIDFT